MRIMSGVVMCSSMHESEQTREIVQMLAAQRKELLLDRLRVDGRLVAKDLATELATSEDTIRRDLRELADAGLCQRVYGGAIPVPQAAASYARRQEIATTSKHRVATACIGLVEPGTTLLLDGG